MNGCFPFVSTAAIVYEPVENDSHLKTVIPNWFQTLQQNSNDHTIVIPNWFGSTYQRAITVS